MLFTCHVQAALISLFLFVFLLGLVRQVISEECTSSVSSIIMLNFADSRYNCQHFIVSIHRRTVALADRVLWGGGICHNFGRIFEGQITLIQQNIPLSYKLNAYGHDDARKLCPFCGSTYCTCLM